MAYLRYDVVSILFASYCYVVSIFNLPDRYAIPIIMLSIYKQVE